MRKNRRAMKERNISEEKERCIEITLKGNEQGIKWLNKEKEKRENMKSEKSDFTRNKGFDMRLI